MPKLLSILCPGQGAQHVEMGRDLYEQFPEARAVFDEAEKVLGVDIARFCFEGPQETLNQTDVAQPAIFVTSVASHAAATARGKLPAGGDGPELHYAGLSLGEYTALHLAGVFDFATGLRLVAARGRYMQEAAVAVPSGMVSLLGCDEAKAADLCEQAGEGHILVPANFNCPGQVVVSGAAPACERVAKLAAEAGLRAVPLPVAGAFHSQLMEPAALRLADDLEQLEFRAPRGMVWSNVTAEPHGSDPNGMKELLVRQLTEPVRWQQTMEKLVGRGSSFVELAPGRVLSGLLRKVERRAEVTSMASAEAIAGQEKSS